MVLLVAQLIIRNCAMPEHFGGVTNAIMTIILTNTDYVTVPLFCLPHQIITGLNQGAEHLIYLIVGDHYETGFLIIVAYFIY
jgi:hypothetical protein